MDFDILGYNFPHWKTNNGILGLYEIGFKPKTVILQNKKELNFKQSKYRITPDVKENTHPHFLCNALGIDTVICDHNDYKPKSQMAIILGARILSKDLIDRYPLGILNIHPGVLPGNRGLDNLKWSIIKNLPIGVTVHFIDSRIDMGKSVFIETLPIKDESIRDTYLRQRYLEIEAIKKVMRFELWKVNPEPVPYTEKFNAVPDELDNRIEQLWNEYKSKHITA